MWFRRTRKPLASILKSAIYIEVRHNVGFDSDPNLNYGEYEWSAYACLAGWKIPRCYQRQAQKIYGVYAHADTREDACSMARAKIEKGIDSYIAKNTWEPC